MGILVGSNPERQMKIEIDYEVEEQVVRASLMDSMSTLFSEIEEAINSEEVLESYQLEDLHDNLRYLTSMQEASKYYTVHTDWPLIDQFNVDMDQVRLKLAEAQQAELEIAQASDLRIDESAL